MAEEQDRALESLENLRKAFDESVNEIENFKGNLSRLSKREFQEYQRIMRELVDLEEKRKKGEKLTQEEEIRHNRIRNQIFGENSKVMKDHNEKLSKTNESYDKIIRGVVNFNQSVLATTSSVYNSRDAFQAFQAPLNLLADLVKKIGEIGGAAVGMIPGLGGLGKAAQTTVAAAIDISQAVIQNQMAMASQLAQSFKSVSDSGMTFGGNLDSFALAAQNSGVTIQQFGEFIAKNRESLFALGGSIADNAVKFTQLGRRIGDTNAGLLASYGSYEALNEGIMEYADLQRRLGREEFLRGNRLTQGAEEYLVRQRELSQITGKSAQALKDEEAKRRQALDFQLKVSRLGIDQQENMREALGIAGRLFGPQGQQFLEEYFATGGRLVTRQALTFQATQGVAAESLIAILEQTKNGRTEFREGIGEELTSRKTALEEFARQNESFAEINRAANNEILRGITETSSGILSNLQFITDASKLFAQLEQDRLKAPGASSAAVADAQKRLIETQREIDEIAKKSLTRMSTFVELGAEVQKRVNALAETSVKLLAVIAGQETMSKEDLLNLANKLMGNTSNGGVSGASSNISRSGNNADSNENRGFWSRLLSSESQESSMARENMGRGDTAQDVKNIFENVREFLRPKAADEVAPSSNNLESNQNSSSGVTVTPSSNNLESKQTSSTGTSAPSALTILSDPKQLEYTEQMLRESRNQTAMLEKLVRHMA